MEIVRRRRVNGISNGLGLAQVASWVAFTLLVVSYFIFFTFSVSSEGSKTACGVYGAFAILTFLTAGIATWLDPADPFTIGEEATVFCHQCDNPVFRESKHCTICHKCIDVFDRALYLCVTSLDALLIFLRSNIS